MKIVMIGCAGLLGTAQLIQSGSEILEKRFSSRFLKNTMEKIHRAEAVTDELRAELFDPAFSSFLYDVTESGEGGVYAALWNLGTARGCGLTAELKKMPVLQETIEIANELDINPYKMSSRGVFVAFFKDEDKLKEIFLKKEVPFEVIGGIIKYNKRVVMIGEDKETYLEPLRSTREG